MFNTDIVDETEYAFKVVIAPIHGQTYGYISGTVIV